MSRKTVRCASHAGSWYTGNGGLLVEDLEGFFSKVRVRSPSDQFPVPGCKAIIAPHAGYAYSGETAAWAYKSIDTSNTRTIFILGPSHHQSFTGCLLSSCETYETPLGFIPLDLDIMRELYATGKFKIMSVEVDEKEHSIEMHLPILCRTFQGKDIKIVPILVGGLTPELELEYGAILSPFLAEEGTLFIASSDFCHWGQRFNYTYYYPEPEPSDEPGYHITRASLPEPEYPIYQSTTRLDHEAMEIIGLRKGTAREALLQFRRYLRETENTICGRYAIGLLLAALVPIQEDMKKQVEARWVKYDQSEQVTEVDESSVSYASGWFRF